MFTGPWVPRSLQLRQVDEVTLRITHIPLCPPLSRLHAYSGSTRDVSQILVNKAGSATHPQGSSGPGCSLFTSWAVGPCLWVHCGIKKLSPTFHLYSRAFWDFSQRALKEFDMQVPPPPHDMQVPTCSETTGPEDKSQQQIPRVTQDHPSPPRTKVSLLGPAGVGQLLLPWENYFLPASSALMQTHSWLASPHGGQTCEPRLWLEHSTPVSKGIRLFIS